MNQPPKTFLKEKYKSVLLLFAFLAIFSIEKTWAQGCECVGCQGLIPVSSSTSYTLNISGATNSNLSDPVQGISFGI